jgi:glycosyltransferase involved in cell wall biosynthesis
MSKDEIKCIFVCNEMLPSPFGGIGNYTLNIASALVNLGIDTTVIGLYDCDDHYDFPFKFIKVKPLKLKFKKFDFQGFIHRFQLYQCIKSITSSPGHWVIEWPDYQGLFFKKNSNAVEIHKVHGASFLQPNPGIPFWDVLWEGRQFRKLENWSSVSQYYADWVCKKLNVDKECFISYIPIDIDLFRSNGSLKEKEIQITFCGNTSKRKHPESLVKAFVDLSTKYPNLKLSFAGNIYKVEKTIRKLLPSSLQRQVEFIGLLKANEVVKLLNSTTVFCLPSEHESFGMAWVEAMACEVPVVAGKGSCAEEVVTLEAGLIVDPQTPDDIAEALDKLLSNPDLRKKMGATGRKIVCQRYDSKITSKRILDWYSDLWNKRLSKDEQFKVNY